MTLENEKLYFKDVQSFGNICGEIALGKEIPEYVKSINFPLSVDAEFTMEADIDISKFNKMIGIDLANGDSLSGACLSFMSPYREQVKRHKKKRINKKWAKRYGFVTKFREYRLEELTFNNNNSNRDDFAFDITAKKYYVY